VSSDFTEYADPFPDWPNCATPDCGNKQCTWAQTGHCFPCSERIVGREEMIRRYNATHDTTWVETRRDEEG
jgi:hypothetical protein